MPRFPAKGFLLQGGWLPSVLGLLWCVAWQCVSAGQTVTLLLSEPGGVYQEVARALRQELAKDGERWLLRARSMDEPVPRGSEGVLVTVGVRALEQALTSPGEGAILALLVPRATFENLLAEPALVERKRLVTALYLDQPIQRQLKLIGLALPEARRVGVLMGPASETLADDLRRAAQATGMEMRIHSVRAPEQLFPALDALAQEVDILLLLPDPLILNSGTLQTLIMHTYRQRLPIFAYSAGLVRSGALLGLYASPGQIGGEAGQWLRELARPGGPRTEPSRAATAFTVDVNHNVARSLGLRLPPEADLSALLGAEGRR
ncbi:MAG TPA: ABC transporter substrate binding protein [Thiobacillaceae bacterium]|nr:ABC transporter substrate binding protein [Thiobacillaceae bacterium]HNA80956.1 ABC transporter substrate binding protein [Thiobacillaceae bacterium]HNF88227.1 ABC transporter substrate binding protein [Thiobacillaceae bacterium]HNH88777.1 ABC transporter substrate binding protein [Thiobacillaceae bacterium]HNI07889.1 ABC transporter substrate binding protein [Thiobacillaceae bacterium]